MSFCASSRVMLLQHLLICVVSCVLLTLRSGQAEPWIKNEATGHCYQIVDAPTTWPQAFNICRNDGGMLAVIESAEEQQFIQGQMQPKSFAMEGLWLGADTLHPVTERAWINGKKLSFTNWAPYQPDNRASEENCTEMYAQTQKGLWNDLPCNFSIGYICENIRPPQPMVTFLPNGTQSIYINLTHKQGLATRYQITGIPDSGDETTVQNGTFSTSENMTIHSFTTSHQPGTCFNFTVHAISGSGEGACISDATMTDGVCFAPSSPHVSLVPFGTNSIQVTITIVHGLATSYEIIGTPVIEGNEIINNGPFPQNLNTSVHIFTSDNEPGTCFNFQITAISGYGSGAGRSEPVAASGICYEPVKPKVTFIPESIQSIQVTITKGKGQATSYEIIGTPVTGGDVSIQNGTFLSNETSVIHNFTTSDLPGTCFNFRLIAISGIGNGSGKSVPVVRKDVCYDPSNPNVSLVPIATNSIRVTITIIHGLASSYEIIGTPVIIGNEIINNGMFPQNLNTSVHIFTSENKPGTCFNFRITAISGYGSGTGRSESVAASGICYEPSKPNVTFIPESIQSIQVLITKGDGQATSYEIIGTPISEGDVSIENGIFPSNETSVIHNFTSSDLPGTCFNFRLIAISGTRNGSGRSVPVIRKDVCYAPSKPHVVLVPTGTNSIRVTITIVHGLATSYEIIGTPVIIGNEIINNGTFPQNLNTSVHIFTSDNEPGTCFNFRIIAISGYGSGAGRSEPVAASGICYEPSKPNVTFIPESIQSILMTITKGDGQATSYEIIGTPVSGGDVSIQNGTFSSNETAVTHNFTTSDLPGTCFNFQFIAISGTRTGAGRSEPVVMKDVCYVTGPISRPVVQPGIERQATGRSQLVFYCEFEPSSDPTVLYTVMWYKGQIDAGSLLTSSTQLQYSSRETFRSMTLLTERYITLGITLFCTVSAKKLDITVPSEPYFAGFRIKPVDAVSIRDSEEAILYIQSSVPFSCFDFDEECVLNVNMFYRETEAENCLFPAAAAFTYCGVRISSRRWNETYNLRIGVRHGQSLHSISRTYNIKFRTDENFGYHEMFRNYTIPEEIQVKVSTDTSNMNGKECHAISDPHMLTFDGRYYENQNNGTYILYKHATKPIQVQMKTNLCYGIPQGPPFCPCGVAIAAGRDVFVIDRCSTPIKIYMPGCDDETLKGKVKSHGKLYQIYLPTGSLVKINAGVSFNIYLYPSVSDRMATSGLCGYLDNDINNDFTLRNGSSVPENEFEAFNSNWEVYSEENLFNTSNYKFLPTWPKEMDMCICDQYQGVYIGQSDKCSPDSRKFCHDNSLNDSLAAMCNRLLTDDPETAVDVDQNDQNVSRSKINTVMEYHSMRNYTENSASVECWSFLNSSKLFQKCSEIPDIDPSSFANSCAKDAIISSTMNWASTHLDSAQKSCLYQVIVNQPVPKHLLEVFNATVNQNTSVDSSNQTRKGTNKYTADFKNEVEQLACPMECSGHGNCSKGKCYCEDTFGDVDCSVDLRIPPMVYGIPERGVCDLQRKECENVSVLGDNFVESGKLSCRLKLFKIKVNETILQDNMSIIVEGKKISFAEVSCNIKDVRSRRSIQFNDDLDTVAIVYGVSISNNKKNFSQDISLLLYDSLCLDCIKAGFNISCKIKEGFDLENRTCIKRVIPSTPTDLQSKQVLIIATVMGSALVLLVGLIIFYCVIQRKKRKQYQIEKREKEYQELHEMERKKEYYGITEEVYDQINDEPDTYHTIHDNPLSTNKSTERKERYVTIGTAKNLETDGYSSLSKALQDECISVGGKPDIPYRPVTLPRVPTVTEANSI